VWSVAPRQVARPLQSRFLVLTKNNSEKNEEKIRKTIAESGLSVKTGVKAGGLSTSNHNGSGLKVRTGVKAGGLSTSNHNGSGLKVRTGVKAGGLSTSNHNGSGLKVRVGLRAGSMILLPNHNVRLLTAI
jgi:hypothetical protein